MNNLATEDDGEIPTTWTGFKDETWQVHKFGGTSVANADCYRAAATIVEEQLGIFPSGSGDNHSSHDIDHNNQTHLAVVVSAMGGKPKVTDLLLRSVEGAANRNENQVDEALNLVLEKHSKCLQELFGENGHQKDRDEMLETVQRDISDIRDILKTVSLMKWQAKRISELVSGYGELWSAQILARTLHNRSVARDEEISKLDHSSSSLHSEEFLFHEFVYVDARRIITIDEEAIQGGAVQWSISESKLEKVYEEEISKLNTSSSSDNRNEHKTTTTRMHFVVTGYVASNTEGVPTTLQRDGSDYSAAIMGRLLQSTNITIWTDVDGVLSADPRRVPAAEAVPDVSYNEAMELAYFGAKVIHPKTMQPAISSNPQIPIYIRNTFNSKFRGSRIHLTSVTNTSPDQCVCGFSTIENMALINVEGSGLIGVQGVAKRLFGTLETLGINVVLISQASSEHSITFATVAEQVAKAKQAIDEEFEKELKQNRISNIDVKSPCSIIAAVGDGMHEVAGVAGRFFTSLGDAQINVLAISQGSSERNISAVISSLQSTRALRALHAAFHLSHTTVRVGIVGGSINIGASLLRLLEVQRRKIRMSFEIDLQVCVVAMEGGQDTDIFTLKNEKGEDSITASAIFGFSNSASSEHSTISFSGKLPNDGEVPDGIVRSLHSDCSSFLAQLVRDDCANHVIFDCTNDHDVSTYHPKWLADGVHVVTANNMGLSGPKELRDSIEVASKRNGKLSAHYLHEVTVAGGLPIISTIRTLLTSGDKIRRIDGIFSLSLSYIMYRISPPDECSRLGDCDKELTNGVFKGDISLAGTSLETPCLFSQAVKEAVSLGLTEKDPTLDLNNEYTSRVMMVLAKELGLDRNLEDIQHGSDVLVDIPEDVEERDYRMFEGITDEKIKKRARVASERGCVLRHVASVDVVTQSIDIKIVEVPKNHDFAIAHPTSLCARLHTQRYQPYPLMIAGPAAGVDCTSSALLAELLSLMSTKVGPKSGVLSRTNSGTHLS